MGEVGPGAARSRTQTEPRTARERDSRVSRGLDGPKSGEDTGTPSEEQATRRMLRRGLPAPGGRRRIARERSGESTATRRRMAGTRRGASQRGTREPPTCDRVMGPGLRSSGSLGGGACGARPTRGAWSPSLPRDPVGRGSGRSSTARSIARSPGGLRPIAPRRQPWRENPRSGGRGAPRGVSMAGWRPKSAAGCVHGALKGAPATVLQGASTGVWSLGL